MSVEDCWLFLGMTELGLLASATGEKLRLSRDRETRGIEARESVSLLFSFIKNYSSVVLHQKAHIYSLGSMNFAANEGFTEKLSR
ncbi:MAG: hypothetical protein ICV68_16865 [Pyrinomonadaceae bacterium]|nr:hypothetical protein [Pyrinomonadaceae bacterium]